jgi:hypothetical protein
MGNAGITVRNPVFGDIQWRVSITNLSDGRFSFVVSLSQLTHGMTGDEIIGEGWHFSPQNGLLTLVFRAGTNGWQRTKGNLFALEDVTEVVIKESYESLSGFNGNNFANCINLTSITFESATPPTSVNAWTFTDNTPSLTDIYVPVGSKELYEETWWIQRIRETHNITVTEFCPTHGRQPPPNSPITLFRENGVIYLRNTTDTAVSAKGLYLTDDDDLRKWRIPAVIIRAGQTVQVRADSDSVTPVLKRMTTAF